MLSANSEHGAYRHMGLSNLRVSRKLALGLACVLAGLAVTGFAFFLALLSIDRANEEFGAAIGLSKHLMQATAAIHDEALAHSGTGGDLAGRDAAQNFAADLAEARKNVDSKPEHAALTAQLDAMEAAAASWRQKRDTQEVASSGAAFAAYRAAADKAEQRAGAWLQESKDTLNSALFYAHAAQLLGWVIAISVALLSGWWLSRVIARPLGQITTAVIGLTNGDHSVKVPALARSDEIGLLAQAIETFKQAAIEKKRLETEAEAARRAEEEARRKQEADNQYYLDAHNTFMREFSTALERLSKGDLTYRLNTPFTEDYEQIRLDFNTTAASLEEAIVTIASSTQAIRFATDEIATAADDQSRRTAQQAASLEQTAAALDEITATVKKTADGASHARDVVSSAQSGAEKSDEVVRHTIAAMGDIESSSQKISHIIGVIDEIAFQTNLLALNAGVEAARAGEAGRGFAVVASEVRALAQRSAQAAKEIKELISSSSKQVEQGVDLVDQMGKALERIMTEVTEINTVVSEIAAGAKEQAVGLQEINTGVNQMDQVTQENAAVAEQTTAASRGLAAETEKLQELVNRFQTGREFATETAHAKARPAPKSSAATSLKTMSMPGAPAAVRKLEAYANEQGWEEL
jgi:methyl-accepting chemotaxis protein